MATPTICSLKLKYEVVRTWRKSLKMSSSKCHPSRVIVSFIGTLVKSDTTSKLTIISRQLGENSGLGQIPLSFSHGVRSGLCGS
jgi:hypothetical protein